MRILIVLFVLFTTAARAEGLLQGLVSEPLSVPVTIAGSELSLDGYVIRPDRPGRFPLVIMVHGTPSVDGEAFFREAARRSPVTFNNAAVAFAQRGYAAVAIMRRGFGRSGGTYAEDLPRPCDFLPGVRTSAEDVLAAITSLRQEPWVDGDHVVLLGHSTGSLAVTAAAAENPAGVVAILNFDGGRHGRSGTGQACKPDSLVDAVAALGRTARVPTLWLYAENDRVYGPALARQMFDAYSAAGAPAQLRMLPPFGSNGHDLVTLAPADVWFPTVEPFLAGLGLPIVPIIALPPTSTLPAPPNALPACQEAFARYLIRRSDAKAFAIASQGSCSSALGRTVDEAQQKAMADCKAQPHGEGCHLYAIGQDLVDK
ncbi:alpha/beta hydrolase family protein [Reyranella soli]|jgi:dienelactone hydrolase|uniref:Serine aminopeptidase S33 domain-containing protein n=1 Tax=Reyranella soli TaxID=1230389 RepID=A0A512N5S6_9HYPH|nr:alpha/beta hydrolase [Reyranella soli]GEP54336.1 hypothetical protein RSO01_15020 [Reyranella soli]